MNFDISLGAGVCYRSVITRAAYTTYYSSSYSESYTSACGWPKGWKRCDKTRTKYQRSARNHPAVYKSEAICCPGYAGTAPKCTPICNPACVNGKCTAPNFCSCNDRWRGKTCQDDISLLKWCSSISSANINDDFRRTVQAGITVPCGSTSTKYVAAETASVGPKISADSKRASSSHRYSLYQIWKQHPKVRKYCCYSNVDYHKTVVENAIKYNADFYNFVGGLKASVAIELRKEFTRLCPTSLTDAFCPLKAALDVIDLVSRLPFSKKAWNSTTEQHGRAILVSVLILQNRYPKYYSSVNVSRRDEVLTDCTTIILQHMQNKDIPKLRAFVSFLPPTGSKINSSESTPDHDSKDSETDADDLFCEYETEDDETDHEDDETEDDETEDDNNDDSHNGPADDNLRIFMKIVEQVRLYLNEVDSQKVTGKRRLILNTGTDYREFLRQKQLDRILTVLSEQQSTAIQIANELKKHSTTKFTELRSYFEKVETFNQQIADADISGIKGRIQYYQEEFTNLVGNFQRDMSRLLRTTITVAGYNIAEKTVQLALTIAESANVLKFVFGGNTIKDIMEAAAAFATAMADLAKISAVKVAFDKIRGKAGEFQNKLRENDNTLEHISNAIRQDTTTREQFQKSKEEFLELSDAFDPRVSLPEIIELTSYWQNLIGAACGVLDNIDSSLGSTGKTVIYEKGYCEFLPSQAEKLGALYEEIYNYQFDLMDVMTAYVKSSVALDAAKDITTEFQEVTKLDVNDGKTITTLAMMGGLSYMTYQTHVLQTVHLYCNILEYMEGGKIPPECKGYNTDIALLLANIEPICTSETYRYYYVPTKNSSESDQAYVNVNDLFAGSRVTFKIPSSQWLVDNEWIVPAEKDYAFYVKKFDVFLPMKLDTPKMFYVTADPVLHNVVNSPSATSTEYIIIPHSHLIHEYSMGPSRLTCGQAKIENPYTSCETENINQICHFSYKTNWHLYPSIFSQWILSIKGGERLPVPKPTTSMSVIIGLQLCKVTPGENHQVEEVRMQSDEECCSEGEYRPNVTSSCASCPAGSQSALAGYYCEPK